MKRGDHIFANGLSQTIDELAAKAALELGSGRDGRILVEAFKSCRKILDEPPFHLTVDKDIFAPLGDTHSVVFGTQTQAFKNNMSSYIYAIKGRNEQPPTVVPCASL